TPSASSSGSDPSSGQGGSSGAKGKAYGDPGSTALTVLERDSRHVLLELRTGGVFASSNPDGSVDITIPGFEERSSPGDPMLPTRHTWVEAVAGRKVRITSVEARDSLS